jgi:hypothetical protein
MFSRIILLKEYINDVLSSNNKDELQFSNEEFELIDILKILKVPLAVTQFFSMDKYVTSPYIIPMVNQLINKLKITNEQISNSTAKNFGLKLIENIEGRFKNVLTDQQLLICT